MMDITSEFIRKIRFKPSPFGGGLKPTFFFVLASMECRSGSHIETIKGPVEMGRDVGVRGMDHIIVAGNIYWSFMDEDLL